MHADDFESGASLGDVENWLAIGSGAFLLVAGASRRSAAGAVMSLCALPLLYRGVTGRWPAGLNDYMQPNRLKDALGDGRIRVRESIRLERPLADVFRYWRQLENLPRFMGHLRNVSETGNGHSHWVAAGPAGLSVEWDARIVNEVPDKVIAWQSLPDSDVVTAGSVNFEAIRGGRETQVDVNLQYAPPAGRPGEALAAMFGRAPSQTVREDLRRFKQLIEAGEVPRATPTSA